MRFDSVEKSNYVIADDLSVTRLLSQIKWVEIITHIHINDLISQMH